MSGCPTSEEPSTQQGEAEWETNRDVDVGRARDPWGVTGLCQEPKPAHVDGNVCRA